MKKTRYRYLFSRYIIWNSSHISWIFPVDIKSWNPRCASPTRTWPSIFLLSYLCRIPKWQNPRIEAIYAHVWNKRLGNKIKWLLQLNLLTKFVSCIKICSQKILLCFFSLFIQITYRFKSVRSLQNLLIETINMRRPFCLRGYFRAFFAYDSDVVFS